MRERNATKNEKGTKSRRSTQFKQEVFLGILRKTTNISVACGTLGIARSTFYRWLRRNKKFAEEYEEVQQSKTDFAESILFLAVGSGESWAILEVLHGKLGRKRGYGETFELTGPEGEPIPVKLYERIDDSKKRVPS